MPIPQFVTGLLIICGVVCVILSCMEISQHYCCKGGVLNSYAESSYSYNQALQKEPDQRNEKDRQQIEWMDSAFEEFKTTHNYDGEYTYRMTTIHPWMFEKLKRLQRGAPIEQKIIGKTFTSSSTCSGLCPRYYSSGCYGQNVMFKMKKNDGDVALNLCGLTASGCTEREVLWNRNTQFYMIGRLDSCSSEFACQNYCQATWPCAIPANCKSRATFLISTSRNDGDQEALLSDATPATVQPGYRAIDPSK